MVTTVFSEVVTDLPVTAQIVDVDIDPDLADHYEITDLPTIVVDDHTNNPQRIVGVRPKPILRRLLADIVSNHTP